MHMYKYSARPVHLLAAALLLLSSPLAAETAAWTWREPSFLTKVHATRFIPAAHGGFWTLDGNAVRHTDAAGQSRTLDRSTASADAAAQPFTGYYSDGFATRDGGLILTAPGCALARIEGDMRRTWRFTLPSCYGVDANADGVVWAYGFDGLSQLGRDGAIRLNFPLRFDGASEQAQAIRALPDGGVLALSLRSSAQRARLSRYDSQGRQGWTWTTSLAEAQDLLPAADGGAYAFGMAGNTLSVSRIDAQGNAQWVQRNVVGASELVSVQPTGAGGFYLVSGVSFEGSIRPQYLSYVASSGRVGWQAELCPGLALAELPARLPGLAIDDDETVSHYCPEPQPPGNRSWLLRRNPASAQPARLALPFGHVAQLQRDVDQRLLMLARFSTEPYSETQLVTLDRAGNQQPTAASGLEDLMPLQLLAATQDAGATYLLSQRAPLRPGASFQSLSKIGADAAPLWRTDIPTFPVREAWLSAAGTQVCLSERSDGSPLPYQNSLQRAACFATGDGAAGSQTQTLPGMIATLRKRPLADGRTVLVTALQGGHDIRVERADGTLEGTSSYAGDAGQILIDAQGRVTLLSGGAVIQYGVDRERIYVAPLQVSGASLSLVAVGDDGSVYVHGQGPDQTSEQNSLWALSPQGVTRWLVPVGAQAQRATALLAADAVYLLQYAGPVGDYAMTYSRLSRIARADGKVAWQHLSANPLLRQPLDMPPGELAFTAAGDGVVLAHSWGNRLRLERLDAAGGAQEKDHFTTCERHCTPPAALSLAADGSASLATTLSAQDGSQTAALLRVPAIGSDAPATRADQPGVSGLWYSPYANGEGLAIDWLPGSRTLFAAWFTYSTEGGNDTAAQRWYTLQADGVSAAARVLELPILRTEGGNFDAGPAVAPRRVGTAKLQFTDCDNAQLYYSFDGIENGGAKGSITLSRLTPATQPCILADGSSVPGSGAKPPAKGFDAKFSGAWYDESTPGQGLQLNIQPDGVFFAPWFAYDPAEQPGGNDPFRQHWFTLQGNLAQAVDGSVEALLVQTIGGAFDRVPTDNAYAVGTATLSMQGCDKARLDYRFSADTITGPFATRSGSMNLTRIGGCAP